MYAWEGMRKLRINEVAKVCNYNGLIGLFILYPDGTEALIEEPMDWDEVIDMLYKGCEIGMEVES